MHRARRPIFLVALLASLATAAAQDTETEKPPAAEPPATVTIAPEAYRQIEVLMRAIETVRENYIDEEAVSYERLVEGALEGVFRRLDRHSQYINPRLLAEMRRAGENPDSTAGFTLEEHNGGLRVAAVNDGGPAARAGVKVGDRLLAIDGQSVAELELAAAAGRLDGSPGKLLTVEILRPGNTKTRTIGFPREQPPQETVTSAEILSEGQAGAGDSIGYVRLRTFGDATPRELADALDLLEAEGMKALVLDLRGNPGGVLGAAVELCAQFLPAKTLVAKTEGRSGTEHSEEFRTTKPSRPMRTYPLAVLVDDKSASSAEIVAGALQDHERAIVVGKKTYGKGSVQTIVQMGLNTGAAMRLTTARFFTPNGSPIDAIGVSPDVNASDPVRSAAKALRRNLNN